MKKTIITRLAMALLLMAAIPGPDTYARKKLTPPSQQQEQKKPSKDKNKPSKKTEKVPEKKREQPPKPDPTPTPVPKPTTGTINGHGWVDLGLPSGTKWATCNVGATSPEGYGDYFAWGETQPMEKYREDNGIYGKSDAELQRRGIIDSSGNLTRGYDAAAVNWGSSWHMPTYTHCKELRDKCTWTWTTRGGNTGATASQAPTANPSSFLLRVP